MSTVTDIKFIRGLNDEKPISPPDEKISEFIVKNRIMPSGTPFPGRVDLSLTPYIVEWLDNMSPYSPIQHQVIKKPAQIAGSFAVECIIGYWMKENPTAIMYMSATQILLEKWATKRLEPMIDSCGIREKIIQNADQTFGRKSRRTGDKTFSKLFVGGFLEMASAQAAASQRADSIRVLIRDEIEGAPKLLVTGEGSWMETTAARCKFWGDRKKITDLSTPALAYGSYIDPAFEDGDKRFFMTPCPMCNKKQPFYEIPDEGNYGLRAETIAGVIKRVYYLCDYCHDAIFENQKFSMLNAGGWVPTGISSSPVKRSYAINSLYSPPRTVTWKDYYIKWQGSEISPEDKQGFLNLWAGRSYEETGSRPKIENVHHLRGDYVSGYIPEGVLFLTAAIDVQRGSDKYRKLNSDELEKEISESKKAGKLQNFPRLEMEILGHGGGYRTWSISYHRFEGDLFNIDSGAWGKLTEYYKNLAENSELIKGGYKIPSIKRDDGIFFEIPIVFVDARDGTMTEIVYSYTQKFAGFYPSMGVNTIADIKKRGDHEGIHDKRRYRLNKAGEDLYVYLVSTNYYKKRIYNRAKLERLAVGQQRPGFLDHPKEYDDRYFKMLFAEEHLRDGSFKAGGRANEALDLKVYNLCAGDAYLDLLTDYWRRVKQNEGYSAQRCRNEITTVWTLKALENQTKRIKK